MMAPSTGAGHTPAELPGGIPWDETPPNYRQCSRSRVESLTESPGSSPTHSALPEWGLKDRGHPQGQPGPPLPGASLGQAGSRFGGCQGGVCPSAPQRGRGGRSRRRSGAAEHVGLQLAAAVPAAPARRAGGVGVGGRLRPWPCLGCAAPPPPPASPLPSPPSPHPPLPGQR